MRNKNGLHPSFSIFAENKQLMADKGSKGVLPNYRFGLKGAVILFIGAMVPAFLLSMFNYGTMFVFKTNYQYNDFFLILSNALIWVGAILAFDYLVCRPDTGKKLNFNFSTKNFSTYLFIFPLMLGMMLIAEFITGLIPVTGPVFGKLYEFFSELMKIFSADPVVTIILAVIMAPLFEEIVFRGIIQKGLINRGVKPTTAIWIAAIVFGLVHGNPWQFVGAVLLGFVLGLVYHKTKSLLMPILLHAFNNGISALLIFSGNTESFSDYFGISTYILLGAGIVIFAVFYYFFTHKYEIHHAD